MQVRQQGSARHSAAEVDVEDVAAAVVPDIAEHVAAEIVAEALDAAHEEQDEPEAHQPHDGHPLHDEREEPAAEQHEEYEQGQGAEHEEQRHAEHNGRHNGHPIPVQRAAEERVGAE
ncbi:hypothetical protein ACFQY4_33530 [Catellatospora bangladeshensis]|uniref:hypothetical protein n=1 Tax=Catellatospora bangladeshensis TaxID=310355 RepID=UPI00360B8AB1